MDGKIKPEFGEYYYANCCGITYDKVNFEPFFAQIADRIVSDIGPKTVLDAGCAKGFLVEALRKRQVDAWGIDISEHAIGCVAPEMQPYCRIASATEPLARDYDLIVCQEVLEHLSLADACRALENLCGHTKDVLFSSCPNDFREPTHMNVQPPEFWALEFARLGFRRDVDFDTSFITSWASRYRKAQDPIWRVIGDYERKFWHMTQEYGGMRQTLLRQQADLVGQQKAIEQVRQEIRDAQEMGRKKENQLMDAQKQSQELQRHLEEKERAVQEAQGQAQNLQRHLEEKERQWQQEVQGQRAEVSRLQAELLEKKPQTIYSRLVRKLGRPARK